VSDLEQKILASWGGTKPLLFKRYIDDIFFVWPGTEEELKDFIAHMNSAHSHIKFTSTYDIQTKAIPFLDLWVTLKEGKFTTDLFKKSTAKCQYLRGGEKKMRTV